MEKKSNVLIIEDDMEQGVLLASFLRSRNYEVTHVTNGEDALDEDGVFQFILLDLNLPDTDGISLFLPLKQKMPQAFIVMLTARKEEVDRVLGLEVGADDYITKPYSLRELEARLRAILRRHAAPQVDEEKKAGLQLHPDICKVSLDGKHMELTTQEFKVLQLLYRRPQRIFSRDQIINHCWGEDVFVTDRVVDAMIARIRKKLKNAYSESFIFTKHGLGYGFDQNT
jgi:DNA-binding response OmpR family regulator